MKGKSKLKSIGIAIILAAFSLAFSAAEESTDTDLLEYLREQGVRKLVICGMMTHMCVEAAVRAAYDYDFETTLIQDACATRALRFGDREVSAADMHSSTLSSLDRYYGRVLDTETFFKDF